MGDLRQARDVPAAWGGPSGPPGRVDKIARASGRLARPADAQPRALRRASRPLVAAVPRRRRGPPWCYAETAASACSGAPGQAVDAREAPSLDPTTSSHTPVQVRTRPQLTIAL